MAIITVFGQTLNTKLKYCEYQRRNSRTKACSVNPWAPPISYKFIICSAWFSALLFYKMLKEVRAPWLVRTSSLYFHKARALRHTSALLRYNARSLRHWYERAQFTIYFIKEIKKLVPRALLSYISTWEFLRTLAKWLVVSIILSTLQT